MCRPSDRRTSTFSNYFSFENAKSILTIFHIEHLQARGTNYCVFCFNWFRTLVVVATYNCH